MDDTDNMDIISYHRQHRQNKTSYCKLYLFIPTQPGLTTLSKYPCADLDCKHEDITCHEGLILDELEPLCDFCEILPGGLPVIIHLVHLVALKNQSGGHWLPFLRYTLSEVQSRLTLVNTCMPVTNSIIFGVSNDELFTAFRNNLRAEISLQSQYRVGFQPTNFYYFNIEYLTGSFYRQISDTEYDLVNQDSKLPGRIIFFTRNTRFDIIIPWKTLKIKRDFSGDYYLPLSHTLPAHWSTFFKNINGTAIGYDIACQVSDLRSFFESWYVFNANESISVKLIELKVLLAYAGLPLQDPSLSSLSFFYTGTVLPMPDCLEQCLGLSSELNLPDHLNHYLSLKSICAHNMVTITQMCILVHMFPTPGIAAVATRKNPGQVLTWLSDFLPYLLTGVRIRNSAFRDHVPLHHIHVLKDANYGIYDIIGFPPPWPAITYGNCETDAKCLRHLLLHIQPKMIVTSLPYKLRWCSVQSIVLPLFAKPTFQSQHLDYGCGKDKSVLPLDLPKTLDKSSFLEFLRTSRENHSTFTRTQVIILMAWNQPQQLMNLVEKDSSILPAKTLVYVMPILNACCTINGQDFTPLTVKTWKENSSTRAMKKTTKSCLRAINKTRKLKRTANLVAHSKDKANTSKQTLDTVATPPNDTFDELINEIETDLNNSEKAKNTAKSNVWPQLMDFLLSD